MSQTFALPEVCCTRRSLNLPTRVPVGVHVMSVGSELVTAVSAARLHMVISCAVLHWGRWVYLSGV